MAQLQRLHGLRHPHRCSSSRLTPRHLHAGLHLRHHGQPQGRDAHPPDVRRLRAGVRPLDRGHQQRPLLHLPPLLSRQCPVLLHHGDPSRRSDAGCGRAVQCLPLLGTGARGQGHRGQLHRHDDAGAVQAARVALGQPERQSASSTARPPSTRLSCRPFRSGSAPTSSSVSA